MRNHPHNAYLESRILTADPIELVRLMYQAAIGEVRSARLCFANRDIRSRANAISKACAILTELTVALDRKAGGEYAERLADLYGYMMRKLSEANFQQREEPMAEVLGLLTTLLEGWEGAQTQLQAALSQPRFEPIRQSAAAGARTHRAPEYGIPEYGVPKYGVPEYIQESAYTPQAWSL